MTNIYDYINNVADNDGLVTGINYSMQESPTTSAYNQIAAQDNPDYAQAIGNIYRYGDINRANFNLGMNVLTGLNNKKYLEKIQQDQRAYAEQLANKKFEQEKELYKLKNMFALRNLASKLSTPNTNKIVNDKGQPVENNQNSTTDDYKFTLAEEINNKNLPKANKFYSNEGFNGIKATTFNLDNLKRENAELDAMYKYLSNPYEYPGNNEAETKYLLNQLVNKYVEKVNKFNAQQDLYNKAVNRNVDNTSGQNYISNKLAELDQINQPNNDYINNKNAILKDFVEKNNAQIPTEGWNSSPDLQQMGLYLINNGIDLTNKYPIISSDDIYLYDVQNGTIEAILEDDVGNLSLKTVSNWKDDRQNKLQALTQDFINTPITVYGSPMYVPNSNPREIETTLQGLGDYLYGRTNKNF